MCRTFEMTYVQTETKPEKDCKSNYKRVKICKGKAIPLQAWTGPEGSRNLRFPDFRDNGTGWW